MSENMINRVLNGRYKITERIGMGGMAEVYLAQDTVLGRVVAVKIMLPQYAADPVFTARFRQEAAAAANLQSPYIVNIYDWGHDQDMYFIIMEYIHGSDLKTGIQQRGAINQRKVAEIGSQVCQALTVAHNLDITHRDIKPQNIMIQPDGNVKVMDFGIATAKNSVMTQTSSVLGTAHYVSPEQAQGRELGPASDIYSLGIVLYEAATGQLPFDGPDAVSVALKQVNETPLPPHKINPRIDPALERIILKAMAKDPRARFATAADMRHALNDFLQGRPVNLNQGFNAGETAVIAGAAGMAGAGMGNTGRFAVPNMGADGKTGVMPGGIQDQRRGQGTGNTGRYPAVQGDRIGRGANGQEANGRSGRLNSGRIDMNPPKKNKKPLIIGISVAVIAIIALVCFFVFGNADTVPDVSKKTVTQATNILEKAGYKVGTTTEEYSADVDEKYVISTSPAAGTKVEKGTTINLVVSKGPELIEVPNLLGKTDTEATLLLTELGFVAKTGTEQYSTDYEEGTVMAQSPGAKSKAAKGSEVTFTLSKGAEIVSVPDVVGKTQSTGTSELSSAGFSVVVISEYNDNYDEGIIFNQNPNGGKESKGTAVTIYVSKGTKTAATNDVIGMTPAAAKNTLAARGFSNVVDNCTGSTVTSVSPSGSNISCSQTIYLS